MGIISYAQNFEDVMLWRALGQIEQGFYIDIGSQHPTIDSVSKAFYDHGWKGIHVEPTKFYADLLRAERPDEFVIQAAVAETGGLLRFYEIPNTGLSTAAIEVAEQHKTMGFTVNETIVTSITLDDVFDTLAVNDVHWLKIDVEGFEKEILLGWKRSVIRPWVVVIESTFPNSQRETHEEWEPMLLEKGYSLAYVDGLNRFYVSFACENIRQAFKFGPNVFDGYQLASCLWSVGNLTHKHDARVEELEASRRGLEMRVSLLIEQAMVAAEAATTRENKISTDASRALALLREELQTTLTASTGKIESLQSDISALSAQLISEKELRIKSVAEKEFALREQGRHIRSECAATLAEHAERERRLYCLMDERAKQAEANSTAQADAFRQREQIAFDRLTKLQQEMLRTDEIRKAHTMEVEQRLLQEVESLKGDLENASKQISETEAALRIANERRTDAEKQVRSLEEHSAAQTAQARAEIVRALERQAEQFRIREEVLATSVASLTDSLATSEQRAVVRGKIASSAAEENESRLNNEILSLKQVIYDQIQAYRQDISRLEAASREQAHQHNKEFSERDENLIGKLERTRSTLEEMANEAVANHASMKNLVERYEETCSAWANDKRDTQGKLQAAALIEQDLRSELAAQSKRVDDLKRRLELQKLPFWKRAVTRESKLAEIAETASDSRFRSVGIEAVEPPRRSKLVRPIHSIDDLLDLERSQFIYSAYQAFLGREPDEKGAKYYAARLASGFSKESVILQISASDEARQARRSLEGLEEFRKNYTRSNHWLFRYFGQKAQQERQMRRIQYAVETVALRLMDLEYKLYRRVNMSEDVLSERMSSIGKDIASLHADVSEIKATGASQSPLCSTDIHLRRKNVFSNVPREPRTTLEMRAQQRLDH